MTHSQAPVHWLFERGAFDDGVPERLAELVRSRGMRAVFADFAGVENDRGGESPRPLRPVPFGNEEPVFAYGSMNLMRALRRAEMWPRLAWYNFARLRCQSYAAHWGPFWLQQDYVMMPLAEVRRRRRWIFDFLGRDADGARAVFLRPDDNTKSFAGGLVREDGFDRWWDAAQFYEPGADALAVIAPPRRLLAEWRLVISRGRVVTGSVYREEGHERVAPGVPVEAAAFAQRVVAESGFEPHPIYLMDVALTGEGYALVEPGSVHCGSLYACDLGLLVEAVLEAAA